MLLADGAAVLQVEEEMEELMEIYRKRPEEEEDGSSRKKQQQLDACWQETLQKILTCQELGADCVQTVAAVTSQPSRVQMRSRTSVREGSVNHKEFSSMFFHVLCQVSGALNLQSLVSAVQQTVERLGRTKQEVNELRSHQQIQIQQHQYCRKYQERLDKVGTTLWWC